jgi:hypothetical protein
MVSVATAVKDLIQQLGGAFMFSREARVYGQSTGVPGFFGPYTRGRGGVLGEVDADVVTAAFGFVRADTVREAWESVPVPAAEAAERYLVACQDFGRRKLAGFADAERLAELLQVVSESADVLGAPLFAGWRALPAAADAPARVGHLTHALRELRCGLHLTAIQSAGVTPLQAVLISGSPINNGPDHARFFGWPEPFDEITPEVRRRWEAAEVVTGQLAEPPFAVLGPKASAELVDLLTAAHRRVFSR